MDKDKMNKLKKKIKNNLEELKKIENEFEEAGYYNKSIPLTGIIIELECWLKNA